MHYYVRSGDMMIEVDCSTETAAISASIEQHFEKVGKFLDEHPDQKAKGGYPYYVRYGDIIKISTIGFECNREDLYLPMEPILLEMQRLLSIDQGGSARCAVVRLATEDIGLDAGRLHEMPLNALEKLCS